MSEIPDFDEDLSYVDEDYVDQEDLELRNAALANPTTDYFLNSRPIQPKREIGQYVAENGFSVPLLEGADDIRTATNDGTLMIRSELPQDYNGFGGIFSSYRVEQALSARTSEFGNRFSRLIREGLGSGNIYPQEYMERFKPFGDWKTETVEIYEEVLSLGLREVPMDLRVTASTWRYIEGTNVIMFRDPHVDGKYHFGVTPHDQAVGDYTFDQGEHAQEKKFRKHHQSFTAEPFVELYEHIRSLPLFDTTQVPVIEFQQGQDGTIYFLQYRRVDKRLKPVEPFDLPAHGFRTDNVRGVTVQSGEDVRFQINPKDLRRIKFVGVYADQFYFRNVRPLHTQLVCKLAGVVLCKDWLSFKNNHSPSAPLILPRLAIGLYGADEESWPHLEWFRDLQRKYGSVFGDSKRAYFDARVTSNGREAVMETDWVIRTSD